MLLLAGAEILSGNVHDAVGVDIERDLNLRNSARRRSNAVQAEQAELLVPRQAPRPLHIEEIFDVELGAPVERACHPMRRYELPCAGPVPPGSMLRRRAAQG